MCNTVLPRFKNDEAAPPGNATHTIQMNDVYVDDNGLIDANDRLSGGLDIIKDTGTVPLQ